MAPEKHRQDTLAMDSKRRKDLLRGLFMNMHRSKMKDSRGPRTSYDVRLDLHGMFSEEAMRRVEKTICTNPGSSILVIHGHGSGILRNAVRNALRAKKLPMVRAYVFGEDINAPGLDGVTVIYT